MYMEEDVNQKGKRKTPKVLVVIGSDSDYTIMKDCIALLKRFEIEYDCIVCSAHRTPEKSREIAKSAKRKGFDCIIAAAGKAHHHSGVALHYHALAVAAVLRPALLLLLKPLQALCGSRRLSLFFCLLKKLIRHLPRGYTAVAYRGIHVVQIGHIELF